MTFLPAFLRLHWPSVVVWGLGVIMSGAVLGGLVALSWATFGATMAVLSTLYGATMVAIAHMGETPKRGQA